MVPLLILAASALVPTQRQVIALAPDEPVLSAPFELRGGYLGFPRISLQAELPPETAMELDADLLDLAGTVVLQFSQEGWRQTVTWVEEGATFTGDESEAAMTVALRPRTGDPTACGSRSRTCSTAPGCPAPSRSRCGWRCATTPSTPRCCCSPRW